MSAERGEGSQGTWGGASSEVRHQSTGGSQLGTDCDHKGPAFLKHFWVHGCCQPWIALDAETSGMSPMGSHPPGP